MYIFDRYNWDEGKVAPFFDLFEIPDESLQKLHQAGLAREYDVWGVLEDQKYKYIYNTDDLYPVETSLPKAENSKGTNRDLDRVID